VRVLRDPGLHSVLRQFSATVARATVLVVRVFPELVGHHEFTKFAAVSHLRPQKNRPFREGGRNVSRNTAANGERTHAWRLSASVSNNRRAANARQPQAVSRTSPPLWDSRRRQQQKPDRSAAMICKTSSIVTLSNPSVRYMPSSPGADRTAATWYRAAPGQQMPLWRAAVHNPPSQSQSGSSAESLARSAPWKRPSSRVILVWHVMVGCWDASSLSASAQIISLRVDTE